MSENDDATAGDRRAYSELDRELTPPPEVEERVVAALKSRGLIREGRLPPRRVLWAAAAGAAFLFLAAGYGIGRRAAASAPPPPEPRYALFLLRGTEVGSLRPEEEAGRVEEYRAWARGLAGAGRYVAGEKLEDREERLGAAGPAGPPEEEVRGFFVISAADFADALAVARGCPHLRHGGRILVRPIAPV